MSSGGTSRRSCSSEGSPGLFRLILPVAVLLLVVAVVSSLVITGTLQGRATREGPVPSATTQPTVIILPRRQDWV